MSDGVLMASRAAIARGSRSFAAASRLLPTETRDATHMLYAWCRHCDDVIDGQESGFRRGPPARDPTHALELLRSGTEAALRGDPVEEVPFVALQRVVAEHRIPPRYPRDHLAGHARDVAGTSYRTVDDTIEYAYGVAGSVGVMMAWLMGMRDTDTLERAADLGIAFQLTNIARDVIDDAGADRIYLPESWLEAAGLDRDTVGDLRHRDALAGVVARLLGEAERYYASAGVGIRRLPARTAWSIATARLVYRDIGRLVQARGPRAWDRRAVVGRPRKVLCVGKAALETLAGMLARGSSRAASPPPRDGLWPIPLAGA